MMDVSKNQFQRQIVLMEMVVKGLDSDYKIMFMQILELYLHTMLAISLEVFVITTLTFPVLVLLQQDIIYIHGIRQQLIVLLLV